MTARCGTRADDARMQKIAELNDAFRAGRASGKIFMTIGVLNLVRDRIGELLLAIRSSDDFNHDNDPWGERDIGAVKWDDGHVFWKIEYFDKEMRFGSEDPADETVTTRAMTILLASEL